MLPLTSSTLPNLQVGINTSLRAKIHTITDDESIFRQRINYHYNIMSCNSSITCSVLDNADSTTLNASCIVMGASNITCSNDPVHVPTPYTYYWKLVREPPDNSSQLLLATLGIIAGYTILVVYSTCRICDQKQQQAQHEEQTIHNSSHGAAGFIWQFNNFGHLPPTNDDSVVTHISWNKGKQFTGKIRTVEDWNEAYSIQPNESYQTNFVRNNLNWNNPGFGIASENVSATNGVVAAKSTEYKQPEGLFVFGESTAQHKPRLPFSPIPSLWAGVSATSVTTTKLRTRSTSSNTFKFLPPVGDATPVSWRLNEAISKTIKGKVGTDDISSPPRPKCWPASMKAAIKAGQRCSSSRIHYAQWFTMQQQPASTSSTSHQKWIISLHLIYQVEQQLKNDLNHLASTSKCKRKRSDSEAVTNGSHRRLRKPD